MHFAISLPAVFYLYFPQKASSYNINRWCHIQSPQKRNKSEHARFTEGLLLIPNPIHKQGRYSTLCGLEVRVTGGLIPL